MMTIKKVGRTIILGAVLLLVNLALINLIKESNSMAGRKGTLKNEVEVAQAKVAKKAKVTGKKDSKVTVTGKKEEAKKAEVAGKNKEATKVTVKALKVTATGKKLPEGKKLTKKLLKKVVKVTAVKKNGKVVTINKYSCPQLGKKVNYNKSGYKVTVKYAGKSESIAVKVKKAKVTVKDLQAYKVNKLTEGKKLTKKAVRSSIKVIAVYGNGNVKFVDDYDCDQIGQKVTYKEEYPHKGQFQLTIKYAGLSKNIWIGVEKNSKDVQPTHMPEPSSTPTQTPEPSSTPTQTPKPSSTPTQTLKPSSTPTQTPKPSSTPTQTPKPSSTPTQAPFVTGIQAFVMGSIKEGEHFTANMLYNSIQVIAIMSDNSMNRVTNFGSDQIGQKITRKQDYPHKGQFGVTVKYAGFSKSVWLWVEERLETPEPSSTPTQTPETSSTPTNSPAPSSKPTNSPAPSSKPTNSPAPSSKPTNSQAPSSKPTNSPAPSSKPTNSPAPSSKPTNSPAPSSKPTNSPAPSSKPTNSPAPSSMPTSSPKPSNTPTESPEPTVSPEPTETPEPTKEPEDKYHQISVKKEGSGKVFVDNVDIVSGAAFKEGQHNVSVEPDENWAVESWTIDGNVQVGTGSAIMLSKDVTIVATFIEIKETPKPTESPEPTQTPGVTQEPEDKYHQISVEKSGGGKVFVDEVELEDTAKFTEGEHTVVVQPEEGSSVSWSINGVRQNGRQQTVNLSKDTIIEVIFETIPKYQVTVTKTGKGDVSINGKNVEFDAEGKGTLTFESGNYDIQNTPAEGYKLATCTLDDSPIGTTVSITKDSEIKVVFVEEDKFVTVSFKKPLGGLIKEEAVQVKENTTITIPNLPYMKDKEGEGWKLDGKLYSLSQLDDLVKAIKELISQNKDVEVFASYRDIEKYYTVTVVDAVMTDDDGNLISEQVKPNKRVTITAEKEKGGLKFAYFVDGENVIKSYDNVYQVFVNNDLWIKAVYKEETVQKQPLVDFNGPAEYNQSAGALRYDIAIDVPKDYYTVVEWGVSIKASTGSSIVLEKQYKVASATATSNNANSNITLKGALKDLITVNARVEAMVYAIIKSKAGDIQTIYSTKTEITQL